MLWAQLPSPTSAELGGWLVGCVAVLTIVFLVGSLVKLAKDLWWPTAMQMQAPATTYATEKDLQALEQYTHQSVHELRNSLHLVQLKIVEMREVLGREMATHNQAVVKELARLSGLMEAMDKWRVGRDAAIEHAVERGMHKTGQ